jgi:hypothetical protein
MIKTSDDIPVVTPNAMRPNMHRLIIESTRSAGLSQRSISASRFPLWSDDLVRAACLTAVLVSSSSLHIAYPLLLPVGAVQIVSRANTKFTEDRGTLNKHLVPRFPGSGLAGWRRVTCSCDAIKYGCPRSRRSAIFIVAQDIALIPIEASDMILPRMADHAEISKLHYEPAHQSARMTLLV